MAIHMKVLIIGIIFVIATESFSQDRLSRYYGISAAIGQTYFGGTIDGHAGKVVQLYNFDHHLKFQPTYLAEFKIESDGRFGGPLKLTHAGLFFLSCEGRSPLSIWIEPGDSLVVHVYEQHTEFTKHHYQFLNKGSLCFFGNGASVNNYMFEAGLTINDPQVHQSVNRYSIPKYFLFLDSLERARHRLRETSHNQRFSEEAEDFLYGELNCSTFSHKSMAEVYKRAKSREDSVALRTSQIWEDWSFPSDRALASPSYRNSLVTYFTKIAAEKTVDRPETTHGKKILFSRTYREADAALIDRPKTREYFGAFILYQMASFVGSSDSLTHLFNHYSVQFPESVYTEVLAERCRDKLDIVGTLASLILRDTSNAVFRLSSLKGKVTYVDLWASWCAPCIQQFSDSKKLAREFQDRINIVYINIDDSDKLWKKVLRDQKLGGIQVRADRETSKRIRSELNVTALPRYILIDKNGKVYRSTAALPAAVRDDIVRLLR